MRKGEIELEGDGAGGIDLTLSNDSVYLSLHLSWAEAEILSKLLKTMAEDVKPQSLSQAWCEAYNSCNTHEKEWIDKANAIRGDESKGKP